MEFFNHDNHFVLSIKEYNFDVKSFTLLTKHGHSNVILSK